MIFLIGSKTSVNSNTSFLKIHSHRIMAMYLTDSFPNRS